MEAEDQTSRIDLPFQKVAEMFPHLLDALYGQFSSSEIANLVPNFVGDIVALYWLLDYFQVTRLFHDLQNRIKESYLTPNLCASFLHEALKMNVQGIADAVIDSTAVKLLQFTDDDMHKLVAELNGPLLLTILQKMEMTEERSRKASEFVAAFCVKQTVNAEAFGSLTDPGVLPHIHSKAVWPLLKMESEFCEPGDVASLSSLQERCIDALVKDCTTLGVVQDAACSFQQPAKFTVKLLEKLQQSLNDNAVDGQARNVRRRTD